jgi:hypothetical protein
MRVGIDDRDFTFEPEASEFANGRDAGHGAAGHHDVLESG